ncbi:unnamed protein product [Chrysoparadoxa australica]
MNWACIFALLLPATHSFLVPIRWSMAPSHTQWRIPSASRKAVSMMGEAMDEEKQRKLREMLSKQFGQGGSNAPSADEWCNSTDQVKSGTVLVSDPGQFYTRGSSSLERFGLPEPIPRELPGDRQCDLLPVVLLVEHNDDGSMGIMVNRRTGMLMGDLGDEMSTFMIQPIWLGGTTGTQGLCYVHTYPQITGAMQLTQDGLYFGGEFESAVRVVSEGVGSSAQFRFMLNFNTWGPGELEKEIAAGQWHQAECGKMSILKPRDRRGPDVAKPMWLDLMTMLGKEDIIDQVMK